jgi:hypothetical protein
MNRNHFNIDHKNSFIDLQSIQTISPTIAQPQHQQQQLPHADDELAYRGHHAGGYEGV